MRAKRRVALVKGCWRLLVLYQHFLTPCHAVLCVVMDVAWSRVTGMRQLILTCNIPLWLRGETTGGSARHTAAYSAPTPHARQIGTTTHHNQNPSAAVLPRTRSNHPAQKTLFAPRPLPMMVALLTHIPSPDQVLLTGHTRASAVPANMQLSLRRLLPPLFLSQLFL